MVVEERLNKVDPPYETEQRSIPQIVKLTLWTDRWSGNMSPFCPRKVLPFTVRTLIFMEQNFFAFLISHTGLILYCI